MSMAMTVAVSMTVTVTVAVAVAMGMLMRVVMRVAVFGRFRCCRVLGADPGLCFELLDTTLVKDPGISSSGLNTCVGQGLEDGLEVLLGSLRRPGKCDNNCAITDTCHRP